MPSVTVDLADLETLVITTGTMKTIESALQARRSDPFVRQHLEFTEAHDRLASAMRNAMRASADTVVKFDEPLDGDEIQILRQIDAGKGSLTTKEKAPEKDAAMSVADRLAAKGCVVMGNFVTGILWAGAKAVSDIRADDKGFAVKITDRGRQKLAEFNAKKAEAVV